MRYLRFKELRKRIPLGRTTIWKIAVSGFWDRHDFRLAVFLPAKWIAKYGEKHLCTNLRNYGDCTPHCCADKCVVEMAICADCDHVLEYCNPVSSICEPEAAWEGNCMAALSAEGWWQPYIPRVRINRMISRRSVLFLYPQAKSTGLLPFAG